MLENGRHGSCKKGREEMKFEEERRAGRNEEKVLRRSLGRIR